MIAICRLVALFVLFLLAWLGNSVKASAEVSCERIWNRNFPSINVSYESWIGVDKRLEKIAEDAARDDFIQEEMNELVLRYAAGNENPGRGSINLGRGITELRGHKGARVIVRNLGRGKFAIIGKSSKKVSGNESRMFRVLRQIYDDFPDFYGDDLLQK